MAPSWITEPKDTTKMLGDSVSIHCHASGHPKPVITWSKRNPDNSVGNFIEIQKTKEEYRYISTFPNMFFLFSRMVYWKTNGEL